jgi:hypothetical protein
VDDVADASEFDEKDFHKKLSAVSTQLSAFDFRGRPASSFSLHPAAGIG